MKITTTTFLLLALCFFSKTGYSQTDSLKTVSTDSVKPEQKTTDSKRRDSAFILYGGVSLNNLTTNSTVYNSVAAPGFMVGASYRRGHFFYWQLGLRYNNSVYELDTIGVAIDSSSAKDNSFSVRDIGMPISVGINILAATDRIFGLRVYVSAIPSYVFGVGSNDLGITASNLNAFNIYAQGGLGIDVLFLTIDVGYNYGFNDVFAKTSTQWNPGQAYLTLGFRF